MRIALSTCADWPSLSPDDQPLVPLLAERGVEAVPAIWDDPSVCWSSFSAVVHRSLWDYHLKWSAFGKWLGSLVALELPSFNSIDIIRWNAQKTYLRDLEKSTGAVVPTIWVSGQEPVDLADEIRRRGWGDVVVKPSLSASAYRTELIRADEFDRLLRAVDECLSSGPVMVQPFIEAVTTDGEWSLIFLAGEFSHAVRKRPAEGDFRVQEEHGGATWFEVPAASIVRAAEQIARSLPEGWLFARLDGFADSKSPLGFTVSEVEMVEPLLFLSYAEGSAARFADAIAHRLQSI